MKQFEDLIVRQKARKLAFTTYKECKSRKDFSFKDQIQRACISISNNIAEGFERQSDKEYKRFLFISKGSCWEFRSMLYLAKDLEYISQDSFDHFLESASEISRLLAGLIKAIS